MKKFKRALISVSDKTDIVSLAKLLSKYNIEIYSTSNTAKLLEKNKIKINYIDEYINFPEILGGRVKTLHPAIFSGLLAKKNKKHLNELKKFHFLPFDIVIINFYPFEQNINLKLEKLVDFIDIGGVAMLRAAAKNFHNIIPVTDINDYELLKKIIKENKISTKQRSYFAAKCFQYTSYLDSLICHAILKKTRQKQSLNNVITIPLKKSINLRYGENPHQEAGLYKNILYDKKLDILYEGKKISYNNLLDMDSAVKLCNDLSKKACVIIKHNNPCGAAVSNKCLSAFEKAWAGDPLSAFGSIIAFNCEVDAETAKKIIEKYVEVVIAKSFSLKALKILRTKKNIRIVRWTEKSEKTVNYKKTKWGMLIQEEDNNLFNKLKFVSKIKPDKKILKALKFAMTICQYVKSNAVVLCSPNRILGIGAGQMSRVDSVKIAIRKMKESNNHKEKLIVAASDAFFPFSDSLEYLFKENINAVISPGGSIRDKEVIKFTNKNKKILVFTDTRHFRH